MAKPSGRRECLGAFRDLASTVSTHLFCVSPSHAGSNFLKGVMAISKATWISKARRNESHAAPGFVGPELPFPTSFIAVNPQKIALVANPEGYDWPRNRRAWYFLAQAKDPAATVFFARSTRFLFQTHMLAQHFRNPRFLFMVRNPYALCEGLCRQYRANFGENAERFRQLSMGDKSLEEYAATHYVRCLAQQRENLEKHGGRGAFFSYEEMCAVPERVARKIQALAPALDDLNLRQRIPVKNLYDEMLTDMNVRQIARLSGAQLRAINRVFRPHRQLLHHYGYELIEDASAFAEYPRPSRTAPLGAQGVQLQGR